MMMKANACMLLRVICERYIALCHKDDLKMKTIGTSCILCVHKHRVTPPFMIMSTNAYTMMMMIMPRMTLGFCWSTLICVGRVYYTSNFIWTRANPYDGFNDRFLIMSCMCLHSLTPIVGPFTAKYFLNYASRVLLLFQVKSRHLYTADDDISSRDHVTCIG